jgi:uncharacterized membrane protein YphA (DoxX/SURF4 family)
MQRSTAILLILLRLTIGWHFLYEGLLKVHSHHVGPTPTNRPFTSGGYFREAPGPLGAAYRGGLGDADDEALAKLTPLPVPEGGTDNKPHERMPPLLRQEWHDYFERFATSYGLDEKQRDLAEGKLEQAKVAVMKWLTEDTVTKDTKETTTKFPSGEVKKKTPTVQRVAEYRAKVEELRDTINRKLPAFRTDVEGPRLRKAREEVAALRAGLLKDLDAHKTKLKASLMEVLTPEQRGRSSVPEEVPSQFIRTLDRVTMWGLTIVGACLMAGFFTRLNCLLGAGFLFMTYLAVPAFPWLPAVGPSEGNYLFVNKNTVEMVALFALATTHTGRWFGLDGLLYGTWMGMFGDRSAATAKRS